MKPLAETYGIGAWLLATLLAALPRPALAQADRGQTEGPGEARSPKAAVSQEARPGLYVGVASCANPNCHGSTEPRRLYDVLQNEYFHWFRRDPHRGAYDTLFNETSELIARNMRLGRAAYDSRLCLDCHALVVPAELQAGRLDPEDGVTCESCHGPAGGWLEGHRAQGWRHEDSVAAGMRDLRDVPTRARRCLACHLGDDETSVGHELIASGHPRLVFELDNYSEDTQIVHWMPRAERPRGQDTHGVRAWAEGQIVAFRESLLQVARRARRGQWPEFAEMSCSACHHSLDEGSWRQRRGYRHRPGQPQWSPAQYAMVRHLVAAYAPQESDPLERAVDRLAAQIASLSTPPREVAETAEAGAEILVRILPAVQNASWKERQVRQMLRRIAADGGFLRMADLESAEQAFWGVNTLVSELILLRGSELPMDLIATVERLHQELQIPARFSVQRFTRYLEEVGRLAR